MRWASLRQAVLVSCVVHGLGVGLVGIRWESSLRFHGPVASAFLGSVLDQDDVRRGRAVVAPAGAVEGGRIFPVVPSRPGMTDYRLAPATVNKPARVRARAVTPPLTVTKATWPLPQRDVALAVGALRIEGALGCRPLLYLPPMPRVPAWMQPLAVETVVAARVWVVANGQICRVEPLVSSGDPSLDRVVLRYLRSWIFLPAAERGGTETGVVRLSVRSPAGSGAP